MIEKYKTKDEAQKRAEQLNIHELGVHENGEPIWCPLSNANCLTRCVCWSRASVVEPKDYMRDKEFPFEVRGFGCDNAMFDEHTLSI